MSYAYASVADLRATGAVDAAVTDARLRALLEDASRTVDAHTKRTFRVVLATKYFSPPDRPVDPVWTPEESVDLWTGDLLAVTSLATDAGDRTFGIVWAPADYDLVPYNAPADEQPYQGIRRSGASAQGWPQLRRSIRIVGTWGYWERLEGVGTTLGAAITDTTGTSVTVASGAAVSPGQTLLIDSEQLYVQAVSANTVTVERGVNGTTAATHSNGSGIRRYLYPSAAVQATLELAAGSLVAVAAAGVQSKRAEDVAITYAKRGAGDRNPALDRLAGLRRKMVFA